MTAYPANPDVIIVGAGTAGLSAAKALRDAGQEVLVLEAAARTGGRCYADSTLFDIPFDIGGSWLHDADINPLARLAEQGGATLHKTAWDWNWVTEEDRALSRAEVKDYSRYQDKMWAHITEGPISGPDRPVADALPASPWRSTAKHWVAQMEGGDAEATSLHDVARYSYGNGDWLVEGGLGGFVAGLFADVPVRLNCPVTEIDTTGPKVRAVTPDGTVEANRLILTVSTGVLRAGAITFTPQLPDWKQAALEYLPNGLLNKVGLEFDPAWRGAHEGQMADYRTSGGGFCTLLFGFYGTNLAVGFVAGRFADLLEAEGPGSATEFCLQALRAIFGNDVTKYVRRTHETAWRSNANTLGAYSYAKPGCADARATLSKTVDERLFFAGEATMPHAYSTVHGAYLSGIEAAQRVMTSRA
ncbi:amine oxidase [Candidatus Rhodobacter oscarellae]|uniref:Tryptophan 2-monooxygenase n=1 Tax=Candidatus Rhodobacter oscarellae TaxID=1675527 RepID=A0A0J9EC71_9RHOB|nr:NAD(P)/FAD-dependent oxidoreductase [Candidatus Rhodobacter lobularis]KMW60231.1 amine oxidase [Candidatus Rhodobacter lobularis]